MTGESQIVANPAIYSDLHNTSKLIKGKSEVKCTLVQVLMLCTDRTAHRGSRGIALLFLDHGTRKGWGVSFTPRPLFTPRKDPVPTVQEAGLVPGPVWTCAENLAPTEIRSPARPARSQSLYWLSYPAHSKLIALFLMLFSVFLVPISFKYLLARSWPVWRDHRGLSLRQITRTCIL